MALQGTVGLNALITGASGGIGSAIALAFAERGIDLALHYSTTRPDKLLLIIRERFPDVTVKLFQADISTTASCIDLGTRVLDFFKQKCDIFISNAGVARFALDIWDTPLDAFDEVIAVNLRPSFILSKMLVPTMKDRKFGRIIFISSIAGYGGGVNGCHYAASKGGQTSMMKNLAHHLAPYGITVNDVAPALIGGTGMIPDDSSISIKKDQVPVGRLGTTEEVARVVNMCVDVGYLTGQSLLLAGGLK